MCDGALCAPEDATVLRGVWRVMLRTEPQGRWLRKVRSAMNLQLPQPTSLPVPPGGGVPATSTNKRPLICSDTAGYGRRHAGTISRRPSAQQSASRAAVRKGDRRRGPWRRSQPGEKLHGAVHPLRALFSAAMISLIVMSPLPSASPAVQAESGVLPRAMFTMVRSSSTVTCRSSLQSPKPGKDDDDDIAD